jgi:short-subunit dehydrogenase
VVIEASSGIGATYADRLARRGHDLILVGHRQDRLETVARAVRAAYGVAVETLIADLSNVDDLARVAATLTNDARITLLINNPGAPSVPPAMKLDLAATKVMIDANVTALVGLTLAALPGFIRRNAGTIVNIASTLAFGELSVTALYSGSRAFILNFTHCLAGELAGTGVRIQAVLPEPIDTSAGTRLGRSEPLLLTPR